MKILVLGGAGMLGHKMAMTLHRRFPDTALTIRDRLDAPLYRRMEPFREIRVVEKVDAMNHGALEEMLRRLRPEVIVNCIGVIKQRHEALEAVPSIALNSLLPHRLAEIARSFSGRVIHFSTDCVFSGKRGNYQESDPSDAEDLYGKTKHLGEVASENALTIRTSIIGRELSHFQSLLEWFLSQRGNAVRGFTRVIYSGVTTNYLARLVGDLIAYRPELSGMYQVASDPISKHELLCLLRQAYALDVGIEPDDREVSDRSMNGERFARDTGYKTPSWDALVHELASDPTPYEQWRTR